MNKLRVEKDFLGEKELPAEALYGLQSLRASENFPDRTPFRLEWYKALGTVKLACFNTCLKYRSALHQRFPVGRLLKANIMISLSFRLSPVGQVPVLT
ncbi:MAG: hypothetical protein NTU44_02545 [Bacteroidetes bacterium]|nr:hypothetical protein [Bacteroidota bacterium]